MKTINLQLNERAGSCFSCQIFQEDFIYFIDNQYKFCSIKCLLKYYPNETLKIIWEIIIPTIPTPKKRSDAIIILSKKMEMKGW